MREASVPNGLESSVGRSGRDVGAELRETDRKTSGTKRERNTETDKVR